MIKNHNFQELLKPTFYYVVLLIIFHIFRDFMGFPFFSSLWILIPFFVIFIAPIILLVYDIKLIRALYRGNWKVLLLFILAFIPGFIFGMESAHNFNMMFHGEFSMQILPSYFTTGLFLGCLSGLFALLVNFISDILK